MGKENRKKSTANNEITKNMEYLIKLLHREWERSGKTTAEALVKISDLPAVIKMTAAVIMEKQVKLETAEMTFKHAMELSRENYILLRLAKKIRRAQKHTEKNGADKDICIELDREEHRLFAEIMRAQEG